MSWIFGYFGNKSHQLFESPKPPLHCYKNSNLILYCGGNDQTVFFKSNQENLTSWVVAGVGLQPSGNGYKLLDTGDWNKYLNTDTVNLDTVNGHFIAIKYYNDELQIFTDEFGLREIYLVELPGGIGFTTRIDWLKYFIQPEIDLHQFGSRWLLQNQISSISIIKNVKRVVCANAKIVNGKFNIEEKSWKPESEILNATREFEKRLATILSIKDKGISLSLSGGLDSRLLLSFLSKLETKLWDTHTFGDPNHPDAMIANQLLKSLNLANKIINEDLPSADELILILNDYSVRTVVTNPISSVLNLFYYGRLSDENRVIIDGGFGEIWRREFANKLLFLGKKAVQDKNPERVFELLHHSKSDIFSAEVLEEMKNSAIEQIEKLFKDLPDPNEIGFGKWIDLFSIKTRLPNYYAPEQIRVDEYVVSFMPFAQKDLLKFLFSLNDSDKKNGRLIKDTISKNASQLTVIPLVKGNITHPFNSSSINARLNARIKYNLGRYFRSKQREELFRSLKDYIVDLLNSSSIRNCELYDQGKIKKILNNFSSDDNVIGNELDWLLSFELFRQGMVKQNQ